MPVPQQMPRHPPKVPSQSTELPPGEVSPAICAMQFMPISDRRDLFEKWLQLGREALAGTLSKHRLPSSVPSSRLLLGHSLIEPDGNTSMALRTHLAASAAAAPSPATVTTSEDVNLALERCFHWIHVPSPDGHQPDLVAILFTSEEDLGLWRASEERSKWLASGEALARKTAAHTRGSVRGQQPDRLLARAAVEEDGSAPPDPPAPTSSLLKDTHSFALRRDDGSLGGWLPADADSGGQGGQEVPATWKVSATVLVAMYPMQEVNRLVLMPTLDALAPGTWGVLPSSVQLFVACALAAGGTTFVLLPYARNFTEFIGFMAPPGSGTAGGRRFCAPLAQSTPQLLLAYAGLVGLGVIATSAVEAGWRVGPSPERLGKLTPPRPT